MKINNKILSVFLLTFSFAFLVLSSIRMDSYKTQFLMSQDLYSNNFKNKDSSFINSIKYKFPTINIFSMPIGAIKAKYLIETNDPNSIQEGIKLLHETRKHNPFLMFNEYVLADTYLRLNMIDSFKLYTNQAISKLPNNAVHFILYSKKLALENKKDSIMYHFNNIKTDVKNRDAQLWKVALASLSSDSTLINKYNGKDLALFAKEKFKDDQLLFLSDFILYGQKNIEKAAELEPKAMKMFNDNKIEESLALFEEINTLHPKNQNYINNYIKALYYSNDFDKVSEIYNSYIEEFENIEGEIIYLFSISLINSGNTQSGCKNLMIIKNNSSIKIDPRALLICQNQNNYLN